MAGAELTQEIAGRVEREVLRAVHGVRVDKRNIPFYGAVRAVFDQLRALGVAVPNAEELDRTAHGIGPLYIPPTDELDPLNKVAIICHEGTHIAQFFEGEFHNDIPHDKRDLGGGTEFAWLYLVNPLARLRFEQRAERARWELLAALGKPLPTAAEHVDTLFSYYALPDTAELRRFAHDLAESNLIGARLAHPQSPTAQLAIRLLRAEGVL